MNFQRIHIFELDINQISISINWKMVHFVRLIKYTFQFNAKSIDYIG